MKVTKKTINKEIKVVKKVPTYTITLSHEEMVYLKNLTGNMRTDAIREAFVKYNVVDEEDNPYSYLIISNYNDVFYNTLCDIE